MEKLIQQKQQAGIVTSLNDTTLTIGKKKPEKKKNIRASTGFEPVTSANTGAMLYQLSYEATKLLFYLCIL